MLSYNQFKQVYLTESLLGLGSVPLGVSRMPAVNSLGEVGFEPDGDDDMDLSQGGDLGGDNDPDAPKKKDKPDVKADLDPAAKPDDGTQMCPKCKKSEKKQKKEAVQPKGKAKDESSQPVWNKMGQWAKYEQYDDMTPEEQAWWASVNGHLKADPNQKHFDGLDEDLLLEPQPQPAQQQDEPGPGDVGHAPQGRIGAPLGSFGEWLQTKRNNDRVIKG